MNTTTFTMNLDDRHLIVLDQLSHEQGLTRTQLMRQALRIYQLVHERAKQGQTLAFVDASGKVVPTIFVGIGATP